MADNPLNNSGDASFENEMQKLTARAKQVLVLSQKEALRFNHDYVGTEHLLLGILRLGQGVAVSVLKSMGLNIDNLRIEVEKNSGIGGSTQQQGAPPFTPQLKNVLILAAKEAKAMNYNFIGTEHLLLGVLREGESMASRILKNMNIDLDKVRQEVIKALDPNYLPGFEGGAVPGQKPPEPAGGTETFNALQAFGRNLTELASKGILDPVIGRKDEIERVIQILCRRTKNNPVLIGEAGVGKTAIVEGLAQAIIDKKVPRILRDKKVFVLDLPLMVAGTKYRGQFEERIKAVIDEIRNSKKVVLFIDELHTLVGAGGAEGAMDAANIIKPALSRGELQCIGATTMDEYRKHIEKDAALERRFQPITVNPPTVEDTVEILKGLRPRYEKHHNVKFTDAAMKAAARLSDRYISGRFLPDKAIDLMDEAGARARINVMDENPDFTKLEAELQKAQDAKKDSINAQKYEEAAVFRDKEKELKAALDKKKDAWDKGQTDKVPVIEVDDIAHVVSKFTGIPLQQMEEGESERLLKMEGELTKTVIGQSDAIRTISRALRRSRADLKDPKRPIGSFIFLGPTGVGKTLLAKALAEFMFGDPDALIQIDMSEYMEKFNVSRLIGSPPGYVGHDEGGQLTEKVRRRPYSVVLFDEIEKAHQDVMHLLLQILEEGKVTDSLGRRINFRNTIVIMTSNIGAEQIMKGGGIGFSADTESMDADSREKVSTRLVDIAKKHFKPEFMNRVDEVIVFRKLSKEDLKEIVTTEIKKVTGRMKDRNLHMDISQELIEFIIEKGFKPEYGARPIRRAVEQYLEDNLAEEILRGNISENAKVEVTVVDGKVIFNTDPFAMAPEKEEAPPAVKPERKKKVAKKAI
ncbi:MAG: NDP-hexose 4-ketoreductase [Lentisphaerae bacterium GWF2_50_93]|nr:MAG: NDP-hexose 4-ketoreductase [Lentisphaerae bacterium GWF2_50_93]